MHGFNIIILINYNIKFAVVAESFMLAIKNYWTAGVSSNRKKLV